jgi:hypothetical protein
MHFTIAMSATASPSGDPLGGPLPASVLQATLHFAVEAPDFDAAFDISADLADTFPFAHTIEVKQVGSAD